MLSRAVQFGTIEMIKDKRKLTIKIAPTSN